MYSKSFYTSNVLQYNDQAHFIQHGQNNKNTQSETKTALHTHKNTCQNITN